MPKPSYTSRYVVSACLAIAFQQQIVLLRDASECLKDLHRSSSLRKTVIFRLSGLCGVYLQLLNSCHGSESEETLFELVYSTKSLASGSEGNTERLRQV